MKRAAKLTPAIMTVRMKQLPRRHRIAHLRALIRQQPVRSVRTLELAASLRDETLLFQGAIQRGTGKTQQAA